VFCLPVILGSLPVAAQSSSYHLEFEDYAGSKQVILVNDSEKPIEAPLWRPNDAEAGAGPAASGIFSSIPLRISTAESLIRERGGVLSSR
jgi:hypothetical protein